MLHVATTTIDFLTGHHTTYPLSFHHTHRYLKAPLMVSSWRQLVKAIAYLFIVPSHDYLEAFYRKFDSDDTETDKSGEDPNDPHQPFAQQSGHTSGVSFRYGHTNLSVRKLRPMDYQRLLETSQRCQIYLNLYGPVTLTVQNGHARIEREYQAPLGLKVCRAGRVFARVCACGLTEVFGNWQRVEP